MSALPYLQQLRRDKRDFLAAVQARKPLANWVISVGNEAGDLDSLACALADAHFAAETDSRHGSNRRHVPLFLSHRNDLGLRPENLLALETAQIPVQDLLTVDEIDSSGLGGDDGPRFALVDHNVLLDQFRSNRDESSTDLSPVDEAKVVSILDHHVDERKHLAADPRVVDLIGSCASLVTRQYVGSSPITTDVPKPLADLLLSAIAIDTRMKPVADGGKAADVDLQAVQTLLPYSSFFNHTISAALPSPSNGGASTLGSSSATTAATTAAALEALRAYNSRLSTAKDDVAHLSGHDLLRRDYKEYHESASVRYGLSTVPLSLSTWLDRFSERGQAGVQAVEALLDEVRQWMDERDLALAGVLTSYAHVKKSGAVGGRRREILVVARGGDQEVEQEGAFGTIFAGLERDPVLELEQWKARKTYGGIDRGTTRSSPGGGGLGGGSESAEGGARWERWQVWQQGNARATRKQVAPALKDLVHAAFGHRPT
ncbi:hypothetical protein JCM3774_000838 [Rhodotorula dairenensis]